MNSFCNDYSECFHPEIAKLLTDHYNETNIAYGEDIHSENATKIIRNLCDNQNAEVVYTQGGTQTNVLAISAFLRNSYEAVICAKTGHINVHETGAVEYTGHKVLTVPVGTDGKLTPDGILSVLKVHESEHMVEPKMVYISQSTEMGGVYNKKELEEISRCCKENGLYLFMDGARFASALTSKECDLTLMDIASLVDAFYIGGTKNGMPFGEALVILNAKASDHIRYILKNHGFMTAKGFVLGLMYEYALGSGLYFDMGKHANEKADAIRSVLKECGYKLYNEALSNQIFVILPTNLALELQEAFRCNVDYQENNITTSRIVTSWSTTDEDVKAICDWLRKKSMN